MIAITRPVSESIARCELTHLARQPIGQLWLAGVLPGLFMASLFVIYIAARCWLTLARLAVASLTPTIFFNWNSRAIVSTDMSTTLRPGML